MKKILIVLVFMLLCEMSALAGDIGLGIKFYKIKNPNIQMPLLITAVEENSPAYKANLKTNDLIIKINDIDTKNIPIQECIAILSNNSKSKIKFEISDSNYLNKQIITIKPKSGFKTETGNVDFSIRNLSQSYIFPILKQENSIDVLLSNYFETRKPDYRWKNFTNKEIDQKDILKIQEPYRAYLKNKNDMEFNKNLYDSINIFIKQYQELYKIELNDVKNILVAYGKINTTASDEDVIKTIKSLNINNSDYFLDFSLNRRKERIKTWSTMANEIYSYSIAYEKRQKANTQTKTPYFVDNTDFREILWGWQNAKVPQKNGIYVISSGTGAYILQSVSGGLLVTAQPTRLSVNPRIIYILSKRQYADNDWIKDNLFMVFDGYYSYKNALGIVNKIYKFKEIPQEEYWNRIRPQKYYFIN